MAPGDFNSTARKQRAVWVQTGGSVLVGNSTENFDVIIVEAGTAVRDDFFMADDTIQHSKLVIPIMVLPPGANVVKDGCNGRTCDHWVERRCRFGDLGRRRSARRGGYVNAPAFADCQPS